MTVHLPHTTQRCSWLLNGLGVRWGWCCCLYVRSYCATQFKCSGHILTWLLKSEEVSGDRRIHTFKTGSGVFSAFETSRLLCVRWQGEKVFGASNTTTVATFSYRATSGKHELRKQLEKGARSTVASGIGPGAGVNNEQKTTRTRIVPHNLCLTRRRPYKKWRAHCSPSSFASYFSSRVHGGGVALALLYVCVSYGVRGWHMLCERNNDGIGQALPFPNKISRPTLTAFAAGFIHAFILNRPQFLMAHWLCYNFTTTIRSI